MHIFQYFDKIKFLTKPNKEIKNVWFITFRLCHNGQLEASSKMHMLYTVKQLMQFFI